MQVLGFPEEREPTAGDCYHSKHNEVRALGRALHSVVSGGGPVAVARREEQQLSQLFQTQIEHSTPASSVPQCLKMSVLRGWLWPVFSGPDYFQPRKVSQREGSRARVFRHGLAKCHVGQPEV